MKILITILFVMSASVYSSASAKNNLVGTLKKLKKAVEEKDYSQASTLFNKIKRNTCLLYTSPSPRDQRGSRMPSSA